MKVLIVHHCDTTGGAGLSATLCAKMLLEKHEVSVCIPHRNSSIWKLFEKIDGLHLVELGEDIGLINAYSGGPRFYGLSFISGILKIIRSKRKLKKILSNDYDMIILNSITLSWILHIVPLNKKSIIYIRETKGTNPFFKLQKHYINKYADGVIFISEFDQDNYQFDTKYQTVIHNSCPPEFSSNRMSRKECQELLGIDSNFFNILFVGGTESIKGYEIIISAMKKIEKYPIKLIIAGKCDTDKVTIANNVSFLGEITNMSSLYKSVDVLVFPSIFPHQARPAFEAGFYEIPVIISDFPQTAEEVQEKVTGLLFEPGNDTALAEKIVSLYTDDNLRYRLGQQNYCHSMEFHSFEKNKLKFMKFIDMIKEE